MRLYNNATSTSLSSNLEADCYEKRVTSAIQIQRAWRNHLRDKQCQQFSTAESMPSNNMDVPSSSFHQHQQPMQLSTSPITSECSADFNTPTHRQQHHPPSTSAGSHLHPAVMKHLIEPDPNSFSSDYSEMAEPIREHLANVQIICREDLALGNTVGPDTGLPSVLGGVSPGLERGPDETEEAYCRRVRVTNYLSLAQEFAALKRVDSNALPFDLHKGNVSVQQDSVSDDDEADEATESDLDEAGSMPCSERENVTESQVANYANQTAKSSIVQQQQQTVGSVSAVNKHRHLPTAPVGVPDVIPHTNRPAAVDKQKQQLPAASNCSCLDSTSNGTVAKTSPRADTKTLLSDVAQFGTSPLETSGIEEFDVYTMETALPHVEWERLEQQLNKSAEEDHKRRSMYGGDRDEIRRRLAMTAFDDDEATWGSGASHVRRGHQASNSGTTQNRLLHSATSLQVCYLNDSMDPDQDPDLVTLGRSASKPDVIPKSISEASTLSQYQNKTSVANTVKDSDVQEDFFTKQARLQAEAKLALAQVRPMAHMQLQVEKQVRKKSPLSEIVVGIPGFVDGKLRQMNRQLLYRMNIAQLQVVVNDLHAQIEALNADLMQQLVDRDDLHMAQDSMLVDIDDLTRRAQEFAAKVNKQTAAAEYGK